MKINKKAVCLLLGAGMLLAASACDNGGEQENVSETSSSEITEETSTFSGRPEYNRDPDESVTISFGDALGYSNCYCVGESIGYPGYEWTLYNEDGSPIAYQFGDNNDEPRFYQADLDGDGQDELISCSLYIGDGVKQVNIFRNNGGVIEIGSYDDTVSTDYFPQTGEIVYYNRQNENTVQISMSEFRFEEFVYEG